MKYSCYNCNKKGIYTELSSDIKERFIAEDGRYLCKKCSVGVQRATERQMKLIDYMEYM